MTDSVEWLSEVLGFRFGDPRWLQEALTHRSAGAPNSERLEFLGDAILNFVIADLLLAARPDHAEGDLSRLRASLVSGASLAELAGELGVGEHLHLGPGERKAGGFRRQSILADTLEAIFGAIYRDAGYRAVRGCIERLFTARIEALPPSAELKDPKTRLQELLQGRGLALPAYAIEEVSGAAHRQCFTVRCEVEGLDLQVLGRGRSRRRAEQDAARQMLDQLRQI